MRAALSFVPRVFPGMALGLMFGLMACVAQADPLPLVTLDDANYGLIADLRRRFPHGAPSLIHATSLSVSGDITFGKGVVVEGAVKLTATTGPRTIPDGAFLGVSA